MRTCSGLHVDACVLPGIRDQTPVLIKPIGQRRGSMNQRRDPIGHLIEHAAHGNVHVGRGDQQDVFVSTTFLVLNRDQSRGLQVPQTQLVEDCQVAILHGAEEFPARGILENRPRPGPAAATSAKFKASAASSRCCRCNRAPSSIQLE